METHLSAVVVQTPGLVAFWDFQGETDGAYCSHGEEQARLEPRGPALPTVAEGVFGAKSLAFGNGGWLEVPRERTGALNIHGSSAQVSVVVWMKRHMAPEGQEGACQAVAGIWNEHDMRQYCLFMNLTALKGRDKVGGHISAIGGPTPGYRYCMDAAIGGTDVGYEAWHTVAMTYDGQAIRAYLDGRLDSREELNPYPYPGGIHNPGEVGGDFTVGAVRRPDRVTMVDGKPVEQGSSQANLFRGLLGGLAIWRRALSDEEMLALSQFTLLQ